MLKFWDLDKNIRENIKERAAIDGKTNADNSSDSDESDENNNYLEDNNEKK